MQVDSSTATKTCPKCGSSFPATPEFFNRDRTKPSGLNAYCKTCSKAYHVQWHEEHHDERRAYAVTYYSDNRGAFFARGRKRKDAERSAPGHHTAADVAAQYSRQGGCCYWCGVDLGGDYHKDHVVPLSRGGGNGPENIVVTCPTCNYKKRDKMPSEFGDRLC